MQTRRVRTIRNPLRAESTDLHAPAASQEWDEILEHGCSLTPVAFRRALKAALEKKDEDHQARSLSTDEALLEHCVFLIRARVRCPSQALAVPIY